jgi:copper resistance protein C
MTVQFTKCVVAFGAAAILLGTTVEADAHAHLVSAAPADKSTVASPSVVRVEFNESLEAKFSSFDVINASGAKVAMAPAALDPKGKKMLTGTPSAPLAPGAYKVAWHVVGTDGHKVEGTYGFTVK